MHPQDAGRRTVTLPDLSILELGGEPPQFTRRVREDINPNSRRRKYREYWVPNESARLVHHALLRWLHATFPRYQMWYATGAGIKGTSPYRTLAKHRHSRWFWQLDIRHAYDSVTLEMCALAMSLYRDESVPDELRAILAQYCFLPTGTGLLTGAPASPLLFQIIGTQLIDRHVADVMTAEYGRNHWVYTRYLDDLMVSSGQYDLEYHQHVRRAIQQRLVAAGWTIAHHKCTVDDIQRTGAIQTLGLSLVRPSDADSDTGPYITLPQHAREQIISRLHDAIRGTKPLSLGQAAGLWGNFVSARDRHRPYTASEQRLVDAYATYRVQQRLLGHLD